MEGSKTNQETMILINGFSVLLNMWIVCLWVNVLQQDCGKIKNKNFKNSIFVLLEGLMKIHQILPGVVFHAFTIHWQVHASGSVRFVVLYKLCSVLTHDCNGLRNNTMN